MLRVSASRPARPTLDTERLKLHRVTPEHTDGFAALYAKPEVMRHLTGRPRSHEETVAHVAKMMGHWETHGFGLFAVTLREAPAVVMGRAGLCYLEDTGLVEIAYLFDTPYWGRGLATEVGRELLRWGFEELELERIIGIANLENVASQAVLRKLGMAHEGRAFHYGNDVERFSCSRTSWSG
ncbi:GNAT family N-acetyltransferase [Pyxidicoccus fallax]|uniref:GNAT family N-acetyltransferase n=1 Tax=Pyxidicoccus fallax TaxID=394095 RepID=A0A848L8T5_9BACT|nr:GNAT family N-acetyltransferase [Pyxidicoccus fallax]NMO14976.1 GNAT family N-acetyltransferase [Pyxidicoccus fallax]NPC79709.1 GNAT family N-acetyltransferase [Pyxidicoccus fallax]